MLMVGQVLLNVELLLLLLFSVHTLWGEAQRVISSCGYGVSSDDKQADE